MIIKLILFFFFSSVCIAQTRDTIHLKEAKIINYSNLETYQPPYKNSLSLTDHTNSGIIILSTLHLPSKKIKIFAIEFYFETNLQLSLCNNIFYFKPIIYSSINNTKNLLSDNWYYVDKEFKDKYIIPVDITINNNKDYLIGLETNYDNLFCPSENGYISLLETKKKSILYLKYKSEKNNIINKHNLFGNYTLKYKLYYKISN